MQLKTCALLQSLLLVSHLSPSQVSFKMTGTTPPLLALVVLVTSTSSSTVPTIQAPWGSVQGVVVAGDEGREMHGYLAIPYALPPVGDLRFHKPQPHPGPGQGHVFVADQLMPACPQVGIIVMTTLMVLVKMLIMTMLMTIIMQMMIIMAI